MSIRLMSYVFDTDLPPSEKLVMLVLCDFANDQGERCHPSKNTVANKSSLSKRQVQRVVKQLADRRLLSLVDNAKGGAPGQTCHYHVNVAALQRGVITSPVEIGTDDTLSPQTSDICDNGDDAVSSVGVSSEAQTGDVDVTRTTSKPLEESSSSDLTSSENTTTTSDFRKEKSEAERIIEAHCSIHHEISGIELSSRGVAQGDLILAEHWIKRGITVEFCRDVFRRRLMQRKAKGQSGAVNFRYWERAIPEEWSKRPKTSAFTRSQPSSKPNAPRDIMFSDKALREKLDEELPEGTDRQAWALQEVERLSTDEDWQMVLTQMKKKLGDAIFRSWIKPIRLLWKTDDLIALNVPSRFMQSHINQHHRQDISAAWRRRYPDADVVLTL